MNEEQTAIQNTIEQWTPLAESGDDKPELAGVQDNCYLCQYNKEMRESEIYKVGDACKYCPYYKKYGSCEKDGTPFSKWKVAKTKAEKRIHAAAFLAQVKTLQEKDMDKKELEHKLKQARKDKEVANNVIDCQIETLQSQLAEAEKPKLRHGDYRVKNGCVQFYIIDDEQKRLRMGQGRSLLSGTHERYAAHKHGSIDGNFIDDLAALAEPLDAFKMEDDSVSINEHGHLKIESSDGDYVVIHKDSLHAFILNLRKMELGMKAQRGKE